MVQLIIGGISMPTVVGDNYRCYDEDSGKTLRMISGKLRTELGYKHKVIEYTLGKNQFLPFETRRDLMAMLKSKQEIEVMYMSPETNMLEGEAFVCTTVPKPSATYVSGGVIYWNLTTIKLEGVNPIA